MLWSALGPPTSIYRGDVKVVEKSSCKAGQWRAKLHSAQGKWAYTEMEHVGSWEKINYENITSALTIENFACKPAAGGQRYERWSVQLRNVLS